VTISRSAPRVYSYTRGRRSFCLHELPSGFRPSGPQGDAMVVPDIQFGPIEIRQSSVIFGDMRIFQHLDLVSRPTLLIGMDTIGSFDTFIIDYKRKELQIRMRGQGTSEQAG